MTMIRVLLVALTCGSLFGQSSFSKSYKPGDKLHVFTESGLTLRDRPDIKGNSIQILPFGTVVIVQSSPKASFTNSGIAGMWVLVKTGQKVGYVFDGFLSRLPATKPAGSQFYFEEYLSTSYEKESQDDYVADSINYGETQMKFKNGISYSHVGFEGGGTETVTFPQSLTSHKEVYLLAKFAYPSFFQEGRCGYTESDWTCPNKNDDRSSVSIVVSDETISLEWRKAD
jgi:hypothetical protein